MEMPLNRKVIVLTEEQADFLKDYLTRRSLYTREEKPLAAACVAAIVLAKDEEQVR